MRNPLPTTLAALGLLSLACAGDPVAESTVLADATLGSTPIQLVCNVDTTYTMSPRIANGCGWMLMLQVDADQELVVGGPSAQDCDAMREACTGARGSVAGLDLGEWRAVAAWSSLAAEPVAFYFPKDAPPFTAPVLSRGPTAAATLVAAMPPLDEGIRSHLLASKEGDDDPVWKLVTAGRVKDHLEVVLVQLPHRGVPEEVVVAALLADPTRMSPALFAAARDGSYQSVVLANPLANEAELLMAALSTDPPHAEGYLPDRRADPWYARLAAARKLSAAAPLLEGRLPEIDVRPDYTDPESARWIQTVAWIDELDPQAGARLALDALRRAPGAATTTCMPLTEVNYDGYPGTFAWAAGTVLAQHDSEERRDAVLAIGKDPAMSEAARHTALFLLRLWKDGRADQVTGVTLSECQIATVNQPPTVAP